MAKKGKGYIWVPGDDPPPIEAHSIAKHDVVYEYVKRYVGILCSGPRPSALKLTLVDGFAGGGVYRDPTSSALHEGSPLQLIRAVRDGTAESARSRLNAGITAPLNVDPVFHFVEFNPSTCRFLTGVLEDHGLHGQMGETIFVHPDEFERACPAIIRSICKRGRARRSIFLLDQYGYTDIPFSLVHQIFGALPKAEVIFTFATDGLINYLCQANRDHIQRNLDRIGLPLEVDQLLSAGEANPDYRFYVESQLIDALRASARAEFFTPFFIVSAQSNRAYWLVHLSNHHRARDAMTQVHWAFKNHFAHYGGPGLNMLGYRAALDDSQQAAFLFNDEARRRTDEALLNELPAQIAEHVDGIAFPDFASRIANQTPAHNQILLEAVGRLLEARVLEVTSRDGVSRRAANAVQFSDRIRVPTQRRFDFTRPCF